MTRGRAVGLLVLANVFWGSSHAVAKTTLETFPPPLLAALRFSIASAVLAAVWVDPRDSTRRPVSSPLRSQ